MAPWSPSAGGSQLTSIPVRGCICIFFGLFLVVGLSLHVVGWRNFLREERASRVYQETTCTILDKKIDVQHDSDGDATYRPDFQIRYRVGNQDHVIWTYDSARMHSSGVDDHDAILARFAVGGRYPCWYDPDDPAKAVLVRGHGFGTWMFLFFPLIFVAIGVAGIVWMVSGSTKRSAPVEDTSLPTVPHLNLAEDLASTLKYRLRESTESRYMHWGATVIALFWNSFIGVFVAFAVQSWLNNRRHWLLVMFLTPFVLVGLGLIVWAVRSWMIRLGVGPTVVEIADHPLRPGSTCDVYLSQSGRLTMNTLRVLLVCEESATYRQGTTTRTETRRAHEQQLLNLEAFEVDPGLPFETRVTLRIPEGAMHSFRSPRNAIAWKILVCGDVANWPDFERAFPLIVQPGPAGGDRA